MSTIATRGSRSPATALARFAARSLVLLAAGVAPAFAEKALNMPVGVTDLSVRIYHLHMIIFWVCVAIAVVVFGVMIYSIVKFRKSQGAVADTTFVHSRRVEMVWTIVPVIILVAMAVPAAKTLIDIEVPKDTEMTIKVTGYQWKWHYDYLDSGVSYFSTLARESDAARQLGSGIDPNTVPNYLLDVDHPLVIPAGKKILMLLTANDVIHAWWVPAFGMKRDAMPGIVSEMWIRVDPQKTGVYRGQCAELCGRDHGFMPIVVEVKSPEDFDAWIKSKQEEAKQAASPAPVAPPAASLTPANAAAAQAADARLAAAH